MTDPRSKRRASVARIRDLTPARVALGRTSASLTTQEVLRFQLAHAEARDAVHIPLDVEALTAGIRALGCSVVRVQTAATQRELYLRRPDLGRNLGAESAKRVDGLRRDGFDIAIVVGDGLSSRAITDDAVLLLCRLNRKVLDAGLKIASIVITEGARARSATRLGNVWERDWSSF
jgi:ethanolamine ammonia-lyase small subunit